MQAETWAYKDGEGFMSYDAERNTVQSMFNKQNDTTRQRIYPRSYEESFTSKQMDALHSGIKEAALNYIEKDKQTKAGAKYWSKRG